MKPFRLSSTAGRRASKIVKLMYGTTCGANAPVTHV